MGLAPKGVSPIFLRSYTGKIWDRHVSATPRLSQSLFSPVFPVPVPGSVFRFPFFRSGAADVPMLV